MKINYNKAYTAMHNGEKMSRKTKKYVLGLKLNKSQLRKKIQNRGNTEYFCPKCGCEQITSSGNMAGYPEVWVIDRCARCGSEIGGADNSAYSHVLDGIE